MIISSGRNYIFAHIPKTGGTSMALALEERAMKDDILIGDTPKALRRKKRLKHTQTTGRLWKHSTLADIDGLVSLEQIKRAYTFTLVRNPWDRLVSYYHWLRVQGFDHRAVGLAKESDFSTFLNDPHTMAVLQANPYGRHMTAADGIMHCSAFIRLEHFAQDAAPLWEHLGFELVLPVANCSDRERDYRAYYSKADAALLARLCAEDISRFDYRF